ncbi:hypothetical protein [Nitrincola sp. A-D6]|uniref:hypothetical protein n=1 Tax=Nitrincola sp. A-D6 TaxID=1545442 RepID=UPI00068AE552|nr:hypothetical protein [Nitrincola sp. A-D6]
MQVKAFIFLLITIVSVGSSNTSARGDFSNPDAEFLITACKAVSEIYNAHDEKRFLASQRTSLSDAMRAGYCLGAIEHYQCGGWSKYSLFEAARRIAALDIENRQNRQTRMDRILEQGVCR